MNRPPITELARRLEVAAAEGDWAALARADADVAAALAGIASTRAATSTERTALQRLHAAHRAAARRCDDACAEIEARLGEMARHKDGWMAYALNDGQEQGAA
jgi:hypothetical protein